MKGHVLIVCAFFGALALIVGSALAATSTPLIGGGTGSFATSDGTATDSSSSLATETPGLEVDQDVPNSGNSAARVPSSGVPTPAANAYDTSSAGTHGFFGLNHRASRLAGTGIYAGTQFSLEPPDQALCVGGGKVVESVNDAVRVYTTTGATVTPATALNQFFGLRPAINRVTHIRGDFVSDPKCVYDAVAHRFILTVLQAGQNTAPGASGFDGTGNVYVAVSPPDNPGGTWAVSHFDTSADGIPGQPSSCPCLGDQPLLGQDAYGVYLTTNSFPFFTNGFNGAWVYALSKNALYGGTPQPVWKQYVGDQLAGSGGVAYSVQPADTPSDASANASGTEYFLSALDFNATLDNRIAEWKLTGTANLATGGSPTGITVSAVVPTEVYGQPPAAEQSSDGPFPYGASIGSNQTPLLNTNDDRMNEVKLANGKLWGAVNTVVKTPNGPTHTGIAYFVINAAASTLATQGYITVNQENVFFPAIAVNSAGRGIIGFSISGTDMHPSTAYAPVSETGDAGPVILSGAGPVGEDGFTGYDGKHKGVARWGDYGAASVDEAGQTWVSSETTSSTRTTFANWGTYITHVAP